MPLEKEALISEERLSREDLDAIRHRLSDDEGNLPDRRDYGAFTLTDVAEAFNLSPSDIQRQLDQIREERALNPVKKRPVDQRLLLLLAVVLFSAAYGIHVLTPHKLTPEEVDALSEEMALKVKNHPKRIHYPIRTSVKVGVRPPFGFTITLHGALTDTTSSSPDLTPQSPEAAKKQLAEALYSAYQVANEAENAAPKPTSPLPKPKDYFGQNPPLAGSFTYSLLGGNIMTSGYLTINPSLSSVTPETDKAIRDATAKAASDLVDDAQKSLQQNLTAKPAPSGTYVMPPPGFTVDLHGRSQQVLGSGQMVVLPSSTAGIAEKLDRCIRAAIRQDLALPNSTVMQYNPGQVKLPVPQFATVTIHAPFKDVVFRIPESASPKYPTAADIARGTDRILAEQIAKAVSQVEPSRLTEKP